VDDIAQEVYLYVYHNLEKYETGTDFLAWVKSIANFRARTHIRSAAARARREQRYADAALTEAAADREVPEAESLRLEALRACLDEMPEKGKQLVLRRYDGDTNAVALGRQLGKSPGAVRIALSRLREKLRVCVEKRLSVSGALQ
jgi:RNA polymerase sigma-70 factor (ECF subfamily)